MYVKISEFELDFITKINKTFFETCNLNKDYKVKHNTTILSDPLLIIEKRYYNSLEHLFPPFHDKFDPYKTSFNYIGKDYFEMLVKVKDEQDLKVKLNTLLKEFESFQATLLVLVAQYTRHPYVKETRNFIENIYKYTFMQSAQLGDWFDKYVPNYVVKNQRIK